MNRKKELEILMKEVKWHIEYYAKEFKSLTDGTEAYNSLKSNIIQYDIYKAELNAIK